MGIGDVLFTSRASGVDPGRRIQDRMQRLDPSVLQEAAKGRKEIISDIRALIKDCDTFHTQSRVDNGALREAVGRADLKLVELEGALGKKAAGEGFVGGIVRAVKEFFIRREIVIVRGDLGKLQVKVSGKDAVKNFALEAMQGKERLSKLDLAKAVNALLPESQRVAVPSHLEGVTKGRKSEEAQKSEQEFLAAVTKQLREASPETLPSSLRSMQPFFKHHEFHSFVRMDNGNVFMLMNTPSDKEKKMYTLTVAHKEGRAQLGEGGYGLVRWAVDMETGNACAVKKISTSRMEASKKEAALQAKLQGVPHVLSHLGTVESVGARGETKAYLMMPLCRGDDGEKTMKRIRRSFLISSSDRQALGKHLVKQLCEGVAGLHAKGVAHRDLKPENIVVSREGVVNIIDFGAGTDEPTSKQNCGTTIFMAPEVLSSSSYSRAYDTKKADMFSLGATIFRMLTGDDLVDSSNTYSPSTMTEKVLKGLDESSLDPQAKDLIRQMVGSPSKRLSADQVLEHPYFSGAGLSEERASELLR